MNIIKWFFSSLIAGAVLIGCVAVTKSDVSKFVGIWERSHYGDIYVITEKRVSIYQFTRATCYRSETFASREFSEYLIDVRLEADGSGFTAIAPYEPAFRRRFARLDSLPEVCSDENRITKFRPTEVFDHVWHNFNDYYAFFEKRKVDWQAQYDKLRHRVDDRLSEPELFAILRELISVIDDGHIELDSPFDGWNPEAPRGLEVIFREGFRQQSKIAKYRKYAKLQMKRYEKILLTYLDHDKTKRAGGPDRDVVTWSTIKKEIGYLRVDSMTGISSDPNAFSVDDVAEIKRIMNDALADLRDTEAMIIDVRFNDGGDDLVGLSIVNYFTDRKRLAVSKIARSYRGDGPVNEAFVMPANDQPYLKPVALIAGPNSASATEIFIMAMRALPQVKHVGEASNGILSDELQKSLPGDWEFSLSNEVYFDHKGENYEWHGIPPQIQVPVFSLTDLDRRRNSALEIAMDAVFPE